MSRERLSVLVGVGLGAFFTAPAVQAAGLRGAVVAAVGALAAWALRRAVADVLGSARCWGLVTAAGCVVTELLVSGPPEGSGLTGLLVGATVFGLAVALLLEQVEAWLVP